MAEVDQAARSIRLTGTSGVYIAQRRLREVEDALRHRYGLRECAIAVRYPESLLPQMEFRDLAQVLIRPIPRCCGDPRRGEVGSWTATSTSTLPPTAGRHPPATLPKGEAFCRKAVRRPGRFARGDGAGGQSALRRDGTHPTEAIKKMPAIARPPRRCKRRPRPARPILPAATPI